MLTLYANILKNTSFKISHPLNWLLSSVGQDVEKLESWNLCALLVGM